MLIHQPALAEQVAQLRTAVLDGDAPFWLPDAVHALIMACLGRIFGRLEQMVLLWQAGQLPAFPAPRPHLAWQHARAPRHHAPRSAPRTRRAPPDLRAHVATPARSTSGAAHRRAPASATFDGIARPAPPHPARAPPPPPPAQP